MGGYKPSGLRVLSGPVSPASPLSPLPSQLHFPLLPTARFSPSTPTFGSISKYMEAPPEPMPWLWSCHKCHSRYPLGATRRCLNDGHPFCGGTSVDKVTGKIKRHRACASEFDYIGWEDFGSWRSKTVKHHKPATKFRKDCEHHCDFPSACHWKTRHTPKKRADFGFLDPNCLGTEPSAPPPPEKSSLKKTGGVIIDKLVKAAGKGTSQLTTLLSTIEEEKNFMSMPGYIPASVDTPISTSSVKTVPKLPELPSMVHGVDMSFPVMDFSKLTVQHDYAHSLDNEVEEDSIPSENSPPELFSSVSSSDDEDVDMVDLLSEDLTSPQRPPLSPTSAPTLDLLSFNFGIDLHRCSQTSAGATAALDLDVDGVGLALGSPTKPVCEERWDDALDVGERFDDEHMLWARDLDSLAGKIVV